MRQLIGIYRRVRVCLSSNVQKNLRICAVGFVPPTQPHRVPSWRNVKPRRIFPQQQFGVQVKENNRLIVGLTFIIWESNGLDNYIREKKVGWRWKQLRTRFSVVVIASSVKSRVINIIESCANSPTNWFLFRAENPSSLLLVRVRVGVKVGACGISRPSRQTVFGWSKREKQARFTAVLRGILVRWRSDDLLFSWKSMKLFVALP